MGDSVTTSGTENIQAAYAHVSKVLDDSLTHSAKMAERANRLLVAVSVLLGSLSYGATFLLQVAHHPDRNPILFWVTVILGLAAGVFLVIAFFASMRCSRIKEVSVPGTNKLLIALGNEEFHKKSHANIVKQLTQSTGKALEDFDKKQKERSRSSNVLDWAPPMGFICSVVFIALCFGQVISLRPLPAGKDATNMRTENRMQQQEDKSANDKKESDKKENDKKENDKKDSGDTEDLVDEPRTIRAGRDAESDDDSEE